MRRLLTSAPILALLWGCQPGEGDDGDFDNFPPLSGEAELYEGWPGNDKLADEGKADAIYPAKFDAPMQWQSPVRSQGSRGVCSIFSTVGLMEHLYLKEGTIPNPDFSEQFLQWSVKVEVGDFATTEGSSASSNLTAINRYGIVEESDWPYQTSPWSTSNDPACTGENRPVKCYTNGDPPASAMAAERWHLPAGRWISSRPDSIKAHMVSKEEAVVVGGKFFYQAWNHGASELPVNRDFYKAGYVTSPNADDIAQAERKPAGHSFLLVGWDDTLEVQKRDGQGNLLTDEAGNPLMEKGFFLFRNSWGAGTFGSTNPYGAGYGWISMAYVETYLTAYVSGLPQVDLDEVCGDSVDNDYDGAVDCDDSDCDTDAACAGGGDTQVFSYTTRTPIPDDDPTGIRADIDVSQDGTIETLAVTVDITHTYQGDLKVALVDRNGRQIVLHDHTGGGADDVKRTFVVPDAVGLPASGTWSLVVADTAKSDTGTLNRWSMQITTSGGSGPSTDTDVFRNDTDVSIPDNDEAGAFSNLEVTGSGDIRALKAVVDIDHSYKGDLTLELQRLGSPGAAVLVEADASSGNFGTQSFLIDDFDGQASAGTWRLVMKDVAAGDVGTLRSWSLEVTR
ncbi:MAG: proprotein convertase P-domain-containing protein [Myxococcales bacterium]|nr:proprotein convertase P-domain-containing protein [Myxococcales bacterium]